MNLLGHVVRGPAPDSEEFVPLRERTGYVEVLRACIGLVVLATVVFHRSIAPVDAGLVAGVTVLYLAISAIPLLLRGRNVRSMLAVAQGTLLADGIYLVWITFVTGGAFSPLRFLLFVHVVVVTLLVSYRTGLKLTAWDSLLFLVVVQARSMGLGYGHVVVSPAGTDAFLSGALTLAGLWMTAFATAAFSAVNERELRRQKADLRRLADMTIAIDGAGETSEIAEIVLAALVESFGFSRGLMLNAHGVALELLASTDGVASTELGFGWDELIERAWRSGQPILTAKLNAGTDPRLFELLPEGHNVLVVPLLLGEHGRLGVIVLENGRARDAMRRWELSMVMQYSAHAALALNNAWLSEEREEQLEKIQRLQGELVAYNVQLEQAVASRTEKLREAIADLEMVNEERRRLLSHVVRAQEDERTRIANDIHDDPLQKLVAAKMKTELLQHESGDAEELDAIKDSLLSCISSLRFLLFDLRPPILDEQGVGAAIRHVLHQWNGDIDVDVRDELGEEIPVETRLIFYRIAREALSNTRKHAEATHLEISLARGGDGYLLRVSDNGVGFDPLEVAATKPGHLGLVAMRERAEMAGGRIDLHSFPGSGTVLEVWMPGEEPAGQRPAEGVDEDAAGEPENLLGFPLDRSA